MEDRKTQTIVIVEEEAQIREQYEYFFNLLKPQIVRSLIFKDYAEIYTASHFIRIMNKGQVQRGHKADYVINLTKQDEFNGTNVYLITMNRRR